MGSLIHRIKYGPVTNSYNPNLFHVAGPVGSKIIGSEPIGRKLDLTGLVDPSLVREDGQIWGSSLNKKDYTYLLRILGQAYLDGRIDFNHSLPINEEMFMLPLSRSFINYVMETIGNLDNLTFNGDVRQYFNPEFSDPLVKTGEGHTAKTKAQQYVRDLLFWKLNFHDYSDHVTIGINERAKNGKRTFIVNRNWSRANQDGGGSWRVVEADSEKLIVSGYERKGD